MKMIVEKPIIHENVLDLFGKEFKFDHAKGIAELIKNSIDAYTLEEANDDEQQVFILFDLNGNKIKSIAVLDFVGMTRKKIDEAYKRWFDPSASKLDAEAIKREKQTLGGHGNGGKFYLREMFKTSKIITYRNGKLNVFGFNEEKQYGVYPDFNDIRCDINTAIEISDIKKYKGVFNIFIDKINEKKNFSLVVGIEPQKAHGTNDIKILFSRLISHPQARRIIQRKKIFYATNLNSNPIQFTVPSLTPKKNFEEPFVYICPPKIVFQNEEIIMYENDSEQIKLILKTSEEPLKGQKYRGWNSIDFLGEVGVIASYELYELGELFKSFIYTEFIYGECYCSVMQKDDYVRNDRSKFTDGFKKEALLDWVKSCVENLCNIMEEQTKKERKNQNLKQTSELNRLLNKWKDRFLQKLITERAVGNRVFGIGGIEIDGLSQKEKHSSNNRIKDTNSFKGGGEKRKGYNFPHVLISGIDTDPDTGEIIECDPRHTAIYQRPIDVKRGIYWINTSKIFAQKILEKFGPESVRWREYLFQRYIDIIIKEHLMDLGKTEANLTSDFITNEIERKTSEILDIAVEDLERFLFQEEYIL